jgi:hypothetical protein
LLRAANGDEAPAQGMHLDRCTALSCEAFAQKQNGVDLSIHAVVPVPLKKLMD